MNSKHEGAMRHAEALRIGSLLAGVAFCLGACWAVSASAPGNPTAALRLDSTRVEAAPLWSAGLYETQGGNGQTLSVACPAAMAGLPAPPLQIELKGAPASARVEVSAGPGLPFVPVYLKNGAGRLPVGVADTTALSRLRVRVAGASGAGQVLLEPVQPLTASLQRGSGQFLDVITNWGNSGDLYIQAVDAAGRTAALTTAQGTALEPDGTGWAWLGRVASASQVAVETGFTETTAFPVTLTIKNSSGGTLSQTLYAPEAGSPLCATPGKDGPGTNLTGVINTYYPLTASISAGTTSIPVGGPQGASAAISAGDLLLVIQMQAAQIDSSNDGTYGDGSTGSGYTSLNGAGSYEYVVAQGPVSGGSVPILGTGTGGGTLNGYSVSPSTATQGQQTAQVIRVPQYTTVTVGPALTCLAWNGSVGGVLALDASGALTLSGTISVDGMGFRGGVQTQLTGINPAPSIYSYCTLTPANPPVGCFAMKGEGIAGTPKSLPGADNGSGLDGYPNGDYALGAPGNAGGGGNDSSPTNNSENAGGGGGGNSGEGGQGGYAWNSADNIGGLFGALVPDAPNLLVMGGGGGAGDRNNITAGGSANGAAGGGIVLISALAINGVGTISADGLSAPTSQQDAAGGGGAGGTVMVFAATGNLSGLSATADGGQGGNAWPALDGSQYPGNRHGPGGGGGGGAIILSSAAGYAVTNGGMNGITTTSNDAYGSTPGSAGLSSTTLTAAQIPGAQPGSQCSAPSTYITKSSSAGTGVVAAGETLTYTVTVTNTTASAWTGVGVNDPIPAGTTYVSGSSQQSGLTTTTGSYADSFPARAFTGSTGTLAWSNPWVKVNDGTTNPTRGHIRVVTDPLNSANYVLRMDNYDTNRYIYRSQDLSSYTSATLRLVYRRYQMTSYDTVWLQVYYNGAWQTIRGYQGFTDNNGGNGSVTDNQFLNDAVDLTPYLSSSFSLRLIYGSVDPQYTSYIYFDNFEIDVQNAQITTTPGTDPPSLLSNYTLQPGQSVTLTYQVQVDSPPPPGLTAITNTATVTANGGTINQSATVTNPLLFPPVVSSPIVAGASTISGTSTAPDGSTITVYKNGAALGTATVAGGAWTLAGVSGLVGGESITATVTSNGQTSAVSNTVIVTPAPPVVASPILAGASTISGTSTAPDGSTITVYSGGTAIGTTTVTGGAWTLTGVSGLLGGESITATVATGGQISALSNAVIVTPAPPVVSSPIVAGASSISGTSTAPDGTTITVYKNGTAIGTATVTGGVWTLTGVSGLLGGENITATATTGGQTSAVSNTVVVTPAPPVVSSPIIAGTASVSGTSIAPAGSTITVYQNGTTLGTTTVQPGGAWSYTLAGGQALNAGDSITATVAVGSQTSAVSAPVIVSASATGVTPAPAVTSPLSAGATAIAGTSPSPAGARIDVYVNGIWVGTTTVQSGGTWNLSGVPALVAGESVTATATDTADNLGTSVPSAPVIVSGSAGTTPAPSITSPVSDGATTVSGTSTSPAGASIALYGVIPGGNGQPTYLGTTTVQSGGTWTVSGLSPLAAGTILTATATDTADGLGTSAPSSPVTVGLPPPVVSAPILAGASSVTGTSTAPVGSTITVYQNGTALGTTTVQSGGAWSYTLTSGQALSGGDSITATVTSGGVTSGLSNAVIVSKSGGTTPPPAITSPVLAGATSVSGTSTSPAGTTIALYANGSYIGTTTVQAGGTWTVSGLAPLAGGTVLTATATDTADGLGTSGPSAPVTVTGSGGTTPPPVITAPVAYGATSVSGTSTSPAGTTIALYANGAYIGTTTVQAGGTWTVSGLAPLAGGTILTATATDTADGLGTSALSAPVTVGYPNLLRVQWTTLQSGSTTALAPPDPATVFPLDPTPIPPSTPVDPALATVSPYPVTPFPSGSSFPDQSNDATNTTVQVVYYQLQGYTGNTLRVTKGTDGSGNPIINITY